MLFYLVFPGRLLFLDALLVFLPLNLTMNQGQMVMSSPLSWAMYLMRRNRAMAGILGKGSFLFLVKGMGLAVELSVLLHLVQGMGLV